MERVLVTGGGGFVGTHLVKRLIEEGNEVTVFDLQRGNSNILSGCAEKVRFIRGDVTNRTALEKVFAEEFDVIYHLSAVVGIKKYLEDPLKVVDVNVIGTRNLLELTLRMNSKFVFTSTSEIYGKNPNTPWKEDYDRVLGNTALDRWVYSTSKALCEHMLFSLHRTHGLPMMIFRFFNVYGPAQSPVNVVPYNVCMMLKGRNPRIYDDADTENHTRCFTYIDDIIDGVVRGARDEKALGQAFNIGSERETTVRELLELMLKVAGKKEILELEVVDVRKHLGEKYEDIPRRVPDVSKARELLGFKTKCSLEEGLKKTIEWYKANESWWRPLVEESP
jgi:UDP-glucose 4-epimerase